MREAAQEQTEKGFLRSLFLASAGGIASCAAISAGVDPGIVGSVMGGAGIASFITAVIRAGRSSDDGYKSDVDTLSFTAGAMLASAVAIQNITPMMASWADGVGGSAGALAALVSLYDRELDWKKVLCGTFAGVLLSTALTVFARHDFEKVSQSNTAVKALSHEQKKPSPGSFDMGREPDYMPH